MSPSPPPHHVVRHGGVGRCREYWHGEGAGIEVALTAAVVVAMGAENRVLHMLVLVPL